MLRGPLYRDDYYPQLSGHETFPIRYGWLKKVFDAVRDTEGQEDNRQVFTGPDAIARFGVGKNMVASMRHWASVTGIVADDSDHRHYFHDSARGPDIRGRGTRSLHGTPHNGLVVALAPIRASNQDHVVLGFSLLPFHLL